MTKRRVALVHDWLTGMRGGEAVLEAMVELFPEAPIFTLIAFPDQLSPQLASRRLISSWMQKLPDVQNRYRHYLPLMPFAIESLDLSEYDLILSSSHCVAKGVRKRAGAYHLSYIHAPMRYMWDRYDDYFGKDRAGLIIRLAARMLRPWFQRWDRASSLGVDQMIANSSFIASQVERIYGRPCGVIHPFADLERFRNRPRAPESFYLMVGAFAPYKRVDLAIEACNRLALPLKIVGSGQEESRLRALAGPTVEFLGSRSNSEIAELYSRCRAFLFPGIEDFGITPVEAQAAGAPVIAFAEGGALETVTPQSGRFFHEQSAESLAECLLAFEKSEPPTEAACRLQAAKFSKKRFQEEFLAQIPV